MLELEDGYIQLSEYVNARTKITLKCPKGHEFGILLGNWRKGRRCPECFRQRQVGRATKKGTGDTTAPKPIPKPAPKAEKAPQVKPESLKNKQLERYLNFFKELENEGKSKKVTKRYNDKIITTLSRNKKELTIWIRDSFDRDHKWTKMNDIYPVYLDKSDFTIDEGYITDWIKNAVREG